MNFQVYPISEIQLKTGDKKEDTISSKEYSLSESVTRWIDKFGLCDDVLKDAREREHELVEKLNFSDKQLLDLLHIIEMEPSKDLYSAWKIYKQLRENRKSRREFKDELLIINNVLSNVNSSCMKREVVRRAVDGLLGRKYTLRIVEEEVDEKAQ